MSKKLKKKDVPKLLKLLFKVVNEHQCDRWGDGSDCLTDEVFAALICEESVMPDDEKKKAIEHLSKCSRCSNELMLLSDID